jgi:hypothetical protein
VFVAAVPIAIWVAIGWWLLFHKPDEPPPSATLHGCFATAGVPSLWFENGFVHIQQAGVKPRPYGLVWRKWGPLLVTVTPGLVLKPIGSGRYSLLEGNVPANESRLTRKLEGKTYGVLQAQDAEALELEDGNDEPMIIDRATNAQCSKA